MEAIKIKLSKKEIQRRKEQGQRLNKILAEKRAQKKELEEQQTTTKEGQQNERPEETEIIEETPELYIKPIPISDEEKQRIGNEAIQKFKEETGLRMRFPTQEEQMTTELEQQNERFENQEIEEKPTNKFIQVQEVENQNISKSVAVSEKVSVLQLGTDTVTEKDNLQIEETKKIFSNIWKNRFKNFGAYRFDRFIFNAIFLIAFGVLFFVGLNSHIGITSDLDYVKCNTGQQIVLENISQTTCLNPYYTPIGWRNLENLTNGEYGNKPDSVLTNFGLIVFSLFVVGVLLNHYLYNKGVLKGVLKDENN